MFIFLKIVHYTKKSVKVVQSTFEVNMLIKFNIREAGGLQETKSRPVGKKFGNL